MIFFSYEKGRVLSMCMCVVSVCVSLCFYDHGHIIFVKTCSEMDWWEVRLII